MQPPFSWIRLLSKSVDGKNFATWSQRTFLPFVWVNWGLLFEFLVFEYSPSETKNLWSQPGFNGCFRLLPVLCFRFHRALTEVYEIDHLNEFVWRAAVSSWISHSLNLRCDLEHNLYIKLCVVCQHLKVSVQWSEHLFNFVSKYCWKRLKEIFVFRALWKFEIYKKYKTSEYHWNVCINLRWFEICKYGNRNFMKEVAAIKLCVKQIRLEGSCRLASFWNSTENFLKKKDLKLCIPYLAGGGLNLLLQRQAAERLLKHEDVIVQAPTGSGKTLAYVLPLFTILQRKEVYFFQNFLCKIYDRIA